MKKMAKQNPIVSELLKQYVNDMQNLNDGNQAKLKQYLQEYSVYHNFIPKDFYYTDIDQLNNQSLFKICYIL
jgi:hypothetical protein